MNRFFSRFHLPVMAAALLAAGLVGCEQTREAIGLEKQVPDEFAVVTRAPLSIPPDFRLRVPVPGAQRPQEATTRDKARAYLVGPAARNGQAAPPPRGVTTGEAALLKRAGALSPDPSIREAVDRESTALADVDGVAVRVGPAEGEKCARCWKVLPEVGKGAAHDDLCGRCADAVGGAGIAAE